MRAASLAAFLLVASCSGPQPAFADDVAAAGRLYGMFAFARQQCAPTGLRLPTLREVEARFGLAAIRQQFPDEWQRATDAGATEADGLLRDLGLRPFCARLAETVRAYLETGKANP
jgi:hypothetical protein